MPCEGYTTETVVPEDRIIRLAWNPNRTLWAIGGIRAEVLRESAKCWRWCVWHVVAKFLPWSGITRTRREARSWVIDRIRSKTGRKELTLP